MLNTERFNELLTAWTESLAPEGYVEENLVRYIAQLDHLISLSLQYGLQSGDPKILNREMRNQLAKSRMIDYNIRTLKMIQKDRRAQHAPPPPKKDPAKAKAKVIPFPKTQSVAAIGRPAKPQVEPEPVPSIAPFSASGRRTTERGSGSRRGALDLKLAA